MTPLLAGFGLGFTVAASFGPINLFTLASGLRHGFWPAYGVSLGASTADGVYAFSAAWEPPPSSPGTRKAGSRSSAALLWSTLLAAGSAFAGLYVNQRLLGRLSVASAATVGAFGAWFIADGVRTLS